MKVCKKLFAHQAQAVGKMFSAGKIGALYMEMGTGKTLTSFEIISTHNFARVLLVVPKALMDSWQEQLDEHTDREYVYIKWDSVKSATLEWRRIWDTLKWQTRTAFFCVNVEALQNADKYGRLRNADLAQKLHDFCVGDTLLIIDEASKVKSPTANRSKALANIARLCSHRLMLTGTEITNSPLDLYMPWYILDQAFWAEKNFFLWRARYSIIVNRTLSGGRSYPEIIGYRDLDRLMQKIEPFTFRAKKADCLDLPEKIFVTMHIDLSAPEKAAYKQLKRELMVSIEQGTFELDNRQALFAKFRQLTGGFFLDECGTAWRVGRSKIDALFADLEDTDEQAIIFAVHRADIESIATYLDDAIDKKRWSYRTYYGDDDDKARAEAIEAHRSGAARLLIANPACAGYGLNLQHCHLVYWYSLPTSPEIVWQAEDRIHRPGQHSPCVYKRLIARGTIDERLEELLANKKSLASALSSNDIDAIKALCGGEF
jgi:SNF2 family DNA or RNA helicase